MFHHIILLGCEQKLVLAPIEPGGKRILDIGCGTGIWAIQMGLFLRTKVVKKANLLKAMIIPLLK